MRVCITINDVLRRHYQTFKEVYETYLEEELSVEENPDLTFGELNEDGEVIDIEKVKIERKILNLDGIVDPSYLTTNFEFENAEEFNTFLYQQMAFEIFAKTNATYKTVFDDLHELIAFFTAKNMEVDIVSMEKSNSKPATLFFLSREKCKPTSIKFVDSYAKIWNDYQIVITAENYLIENKRDRRKLSKIETENNRHLEQGIACKNLKEVLNKFKK